MARHPHQHLPNFLLTANLRPQEQRYPVVVMLVSWWWTLLLRPSVHGMLPRRVTSDPTTANGPVDPHALHTIRHLPYCGIQGTYMTPGAWDATV